MMVEGLFGAHTLSAAVLMAAAVADRYCIRNGAVELTGVRAGTPSNDYARFELTYSSNQRFIKSELIYTVRDKEDPTTVIHGKKGTLDFATNGFNREFLLIDKKLLHPGRWVINVKVVTTGSRLNPLHKIFPIETFIQQEVEIKL